MPIKYHMVDILPLLPVDQPSGNKSSYNIPCPCCDNDNKRNKHLNINLVKNVFRCPRCGFSGGVLDFYSYFANLNRDEALRAISDKLRIYNFDIGIKTTKPEQKEPEIKEYPLADIDTRDTTYRALLNKLSLASDHRENLLERGLTEKVISEKCYRTTPIVGLRVIAKQLQEEGLYLSGVPGFYRDNSEQWTFTETQRGIIIPVCDVQNRIQGLQVRRDKTVHRKFRWISSSERKDGCKAEGWTHFAGEVRDEILLIEGPMKADIVNCLTGMTVLAVPGVNSLTQLQTALSELIALGVKRITTCFDMDMMKNFYVQKGYYSLLWLLDEMGLKFGTYIWDPHYNGLDDYVWKYCLRKDI